ncbi:pentatricopeptide repeat-containing protein At2g13600-like [Magnolia sinica]|uniref:pentatricopeptide repeat-containing protein At2g13600-like n=1 Tax=Magnolia sinica TaxID=86752 RepID=UPI002657B1E9|nr:pentatricopeptide repeat-containing protein At2g13600-like [Magnolia sinica]XP_058094092.1 pentatricopeptide repeat-containing protein At2g13600-like [Magnolia sinica]
MFLHTSIHLNFKMESCCTSLLNPPKSPTSLLHLPTFSNFNFQCRKPSNHLSFPKPKPTSKTTKSNASDPRPEIPDCRIRSKDDELKWGFDKTKNHFDIVSNSSTAKERYAQLLRQFVEYKKLDEAGDLYFVMKDNGLEPGIVLETVLIDLFMKSGQVSDAFYVFERMPERNVVTWTSIISGCVQNGRWGIGFSLFVEMLESGVLPNDFTFNVVLQACADPAVDDVGKQVHSLVVRVGLNGDCRIENCLIDFYSKCGLVDEAQKVFVRMQDPDLVSFTSMIAGFCKNDLFKSAARLFDQMRRLGLEPNEHTVTTILAACDHQLGEQIHAYMIKTLLHQSLYSASALIEFYSKNNSVERAELIFEKLEARNVVTWSTMISCCLRNGLVNKAMKLFCKMAYLGIEPNEFTLATAIGACGLCSGSISLGQQLHCSIIKLNLASDDRIFNALLTMYARNGNIEELTKVFERIQDPDIVSWCAAISGYSQNGFSEKSVSLLCLMHRTGAKPNEYGFSSALSSCASLALLHQGRQFHGFALKLGCDFDVCVGNALINMYAKCGNIDDARFAFDGIHSHDVMSWNTLIHGYAHHGHGRKALQVFDEMLELGCIFPDHATFVGVLSACSHVGFVEEAFRYFKIMDSHYGIAPSMSHYACLIDVMGRAGRLDEAAQIICQMPFEPDSLIWKTLLASCRVHKNLELGKLAAERAIELSPQDAANYVLLSNLHATCEEWEDAERTRKMMEEKGVKKDAGWSWIEIRSEVHSFIARDQSHPRTQAIYKKLDELVIEMKEEGYCPDLSFALQDS